VRNVTAEPRMRAWLLALFAGVALVLAAVGVYGVVGYLVGLRTQEIAVRLALGARQSSVLTLMLWEGLRPITLGLIAGVAISLAATRLVSSMLFNTSPTDIATYAIVILMLVATGCAAVLVPARRASRVDPAAALRAE
jgi:ABC-type antimicrobial peptide transport system permease subunit